MSITAFTVRLFQIITRTPNLLVWGIMKITVVPKSTVLIHLKTKVLDGAASIAKGLTLAPVAGLFHQFWLVQPVSPE